MKDPDKFEKVMNLLKVIMLAGVGLGFLQGCGSDDSPKDKTHAIESRPYTEEEKTRLREQEQEQAERRAKERLEREAAEARQAEIDKYKDNTAPTGSQPYAGCYGFNSPCDYQGCSDIEIIASRSSDVIVTLKQNGKVVRHAYISAGSKYVFEVPNGTYQPFFYYGIGWNPNKPMVSSNCENLTGGFVMNEHVGKDNPESLYNQILTYELIEQVGGNFNTIPSSTDEAF